MPLPSAAELKPLLARITAFIMTLSVGDNYIKGAGDCVPATGVACSYIFYNANLARVLLASYRITGDEAHLAEGLRWCDTFIGLQDTGLSHDGKDEVGWWNTGYDTLYIADTGTAVTALALCYDLSAAQPARRQAYGKALYRFERFVRRGTQKTPQCTPVLPHVSNCSFDDADETSDGWITDPSAPGLDAGGVGDGYYKGSINLSPYTISTALSGGVFFAELYAITNASAPLRSTYAQITKGAATWLLNHKFPNGTIPYIIDPPTNIPHEYQCISYSAEAFIDLHLRFGSAVLPQLRALNNTIEYLLRMQGPSGALLPNGTTGEIRRSGRAASLLHWWYSNVAPHDERVASAVRMYMVGWLQSEEGAKVEGIGEMALSSGFVGLAAADLIQPWASFAH